MGERTSYAPGAFSWVDLATSDAGAAKAFYATFLGWDYDDQPVPGDGTYSLARVGGKQVAAIYERSDVPPAWLSYVTVEDADASAERVRELGGDVLQDAFDVMDVGRMAVAQDPQGAIFAVWQAGRSIGAELVNAAGALCLNQLTTSDPAAAPDFYTGLFGWRFEQASEDPPYWGIFNGDTLNGGMMPLPPDSPAPPHWLAYFAVDDLDAATAHVREGAGELLVEPMQIPTGSRIAVAQDPQGAAFALYAGYLDP